MKRPARTGERGSASVELALLTPVLITVLLLMVAFGRLARGRADVDSAARDAARAASLARGPDSARTMAEDAAAATLATEGLSCRSFRVALDMTDFRPGGLVAADVTCAPCRLEPASPPGDEDDHIPFGVRGGSVPGDPSAPRGATNQAG